MKKTLCLLLAVILVAGLCACGGTTSSEPQETTTGTPTMDVTATDADKQQLLALYEGCVAYHGEAHDHADTGGTSDGHVDLQGWKDGMAALNMDFASIADHKQLLHMRLDEWDNTMFIGGSEAQTYISGMPEGSKMHYYMMFTDADAFESVLNEFIVDFEYINDHFVYKAFTRERMVQLIAAIKEKGGMYIHVHPKAQGYLNSTDPLDYWFADWTGLEVWYSYKDKDMNHQVNQENYKLWTDLLAAGKYVWATAGYDNHRQPGTNSLTTVYAEQRHADSFLSHMRVGDSTCGAIGIRMSIGDTKTGSQTDFNGKRLSICIADFHESLDATHTYRMDLLKDAEVIHSQTISSTEENWFAIDADESANFYRVEIFDETLGSIVAVGNPIWND